MCVEFGELVEGASLKSASDSGFRLVQALNLPYQLSTFSVRF